MQSHRGHVASGVLISPHISGSLSIRVDWITQLYHYQTFSITVDLELAGMTLTLLAALSNADMGKGRMRSNNDCAELTKGKGARKKENI